MDSRTPIWRRVPAFLAFLLPLIVYSFTLAPTVTLEDSAEYCAAAWTLSPAHPPGSPTWVLLAHLVKYIPLGTFVQRTNFFSAVCISLASLFLFLLINRVMRKWEVALAIAFIAAFSRCVWGQAVVTYNYSLNLMMVLLCLYLAQRWRETGRITWLAAVALCGGLGTGVHHLFILLAPVTLMYSIWGKLHEILQPKRILLCMTALCLGLTVLAFLPIRSAQKPPIQWASIDSFSSFWEYFSRHLYKEAEGGIWYSGKLSDSLQFGLAFLKGLPREQGGLLPLFALGGIFLCWKRNRCLLGIFGSIILLNVPVLLAMGGSQFTPTSEYINHLYYLPATTALAVFTGFGWWMVVEWLVRFAGGVSQRGLIHKGGSGFAMDSRLRGYDEPMDWFRKASISRVLVLCAPLFPLGLNWKACDRSDYWIAEEYARNLLRSIPQGCAVFPLTNNETFLLAYCRFVEGNQKAWLLDTRFGWNENEVPKGVLTTWDVGQSAPNPLLELFTGSEAIPINILYLIRKGEKPEGLDQFRHVQPIDYSIRKGPEQFPYLSPFERMIFASYSAYYAGLGARYHLEGKVEERNQAWKQAENLNPGDSYCHFLLGRIYDESKTQSIEQVRWHYRKALDTFNSVYDPLDTRFYGVTREMIRRRLEALNGAGMTLPDDH